MLKKKTILLGVLLPVFLIGCGSDVDSAKDRQVIAKVNGAELTMSQLDYEISLTGQGAAQVTDGFANKTLENLVSQQVITQKAVAEKLDRDPQVMLALERAKRQVLAQAYMKKLAERNATPPSKQEISDYYSNHPELFSKRRIYQIREILLDKTVPIAEIQTKMQESVSLEMLVNWLESKKVKMQSAIVVKPAEQLPTDMLSRLVQMQQGQAMAVETPTNISLSILLDSRDQPLNEEQATQAIERFITNQKREKIIETEIQRLRGEAKLELLGKFSAKEKEPVSSGVPQVENTPK